MTQWMYTEVEKLIVTYPIVKTGKPVSGTEANSSLLQIVDDVEMERFQSGPYTQQNLHLYGQVLPRTFIMT